MGWHTVVWVVVTYLAFTLGRWATVLELARFLNTYLPNTDYRIQVGHFGRTRIEVIDKED
jgi:hypothetical protein